MKDIMKTILILMIFVTFALIFSFSNQNSQKSMSISRRVTEKLTQNIEWIQKLEKVEKENTLLKIETMIRKIAHFSIYFLFGMIMMSLMSIYHMKLRYKILCSFSIGFFYAIFDEIHQMFIPGRTGRALDVLIDSCGIISGIGIILLIQSIVRKLVSGRKK